MAAHASSRPSGSEDAFSDIPDFTAKPHDTSTGFNKKITGGKDTKKQVNYSYSEIPDETGTKIYIGKKMTDTQEYISSSYADDTTLTGLSIDTDFENKSKIEMQEDNVVAKLSETTITTIEDVVKSQDATLKQPLIVEDEIAGTFIQNGNDANVILTKKEKILPSNISLDITSEELRRRLPSADEKIPLGSGVIAGILGSGGMAKVYRIWNEKLEVYRAVKVLIPTSQKIAWTRFQTEAKISAKLHHPNIIEVHSIGDWYGIPYIEMDEVEGDTLSLLISRFKALPSILVSAITVQVARALAYAHCQEVVIYGKTYKGLIHRDLKPSNIMIGRNGVVKLMDFGVARPVETGLHTIDTENIVGTIHYFSPEQISGYPIDTLSDIYSFGAVIYEMLCGVNPFPQVSMIQLIRAKEKNQFIRLEEYPKPIDSRMASVAQVCLRTDKKGRYQSAALLCEHLEEIHRCQNMGSAEEIVKSFLLDPQKMYEESERSHKHVSIVRHEEKEPIPAVLQEVKINVEDKQDILPHSSRSDYQSIINKSEYLREKRKRNGFILFLFLMLIVLILAGIFILSSNLIIISGRWSEFILDYRQSAQNVEFIKEV